MNNTELELMLDLQIENIKLKVALESCIRDGIQLIGIGLHEGAIAKDDPRLLKAYSAIPADESTAFGAYKMLL